MSTDADVNAADATIDWKAASDAAGARRAELGLTQEQVIERMDPAFAINIDAYRRFERNEQSSYRRTTLAAISVALGWESDTLYGVAHGRLIAITGAEVADLRSQIAELRETINHVAEVVARIASDPRRGEEPSVDPRRDR